MEFRLIDYSPVLYGGDVPPERSGKFIQAVDRDEDVELLILSPYDLSKYHAQILERYCHLNGIEGRYVKMPTSFLVTGADIDVIGGGHWRIEGGTLRLSGESTMYGRFDPDGLVGKIAALPAYRAMSVVVE